jgi:hypothetical protein
MSRKHFSEFTRFFPKGMNPFKIHKRFKLGSVLELITSILFGLKSTQWRKLFKIFRFSPMKSLNIFGAREASILNLEFELSLKFGKEFNWPGAHQSAAQKDFNRGTR